MERNVSYTFVGAIFLLLIACVAAFVFWAGKFNVNHHGHLVYRVYTVEDMSGIRVDSPVKYKGISVGSVIKMGFKKGDTDVIELHVAISEDVKVRTGSSLMIDSQGLAGLNYLSLHQNSDGAVISSKEDAVLILRKNTFRKLIDGAEDIKRSMDGLMQNIMQVTDGSRIDELVEFILHFQSTKEHLDNALISIDRLVSHLDKRLERGDFDYKSTAVSALDTLRDSLVNLNGLIERGSNFLDRLEDDPYNTLLGKKE